MRIVGRAGRAPINHGGMRAISGPWFDGTCETFRCSNKFNFRVTARKT